MLRFALNAATARAATGCHCGDDSHTSEHWNAWRAGRGSGAPGTGSLAASAPPGPLWQEERTRALKIQLTQFKFFKIGLQNQVSRRVNKLT